MPEWVAVEPLVDTPEQTAYWQREFKVGDRVRVRLSGECQMPTDAFGKLIGVGHPHISGECIGTVIPCPWLAQGCAHAEKWGHPYAVEFDGGIEVDGQVWRGSHFAACELEPAP